MGVMNGLTKAILGKSRGASSLNSRSGAAPTAGALAPPHPVVIDWSDDEPPPTRGERRREARREGTSLSSRQKREALEDLRDISDQVLGLVRKVDVHLDSQAERQEQLVEFAERSTQSCVSLDERQGELNETVRRLALAADAHRSRELEMLDRQQETLAGIQRMVERTGTSERRIADTLDEMGDTMRHVRESNRALGDALVDLRKGDIDREAMLARQMRRSTRLAAGAMGGACVLAVLTIAALTLSGSGG